MSSDDPRESLRATIASARRRVVWQSFLRAVLSALLVLLPLAIALVAIDRYLLTGQWSIPAVGAVGALAVLWASVAVVRSRASILSTAMSIDERADLKGRVSSAWEFLGAEKRLDGPRRAQVRDAMLHARNVRLRSAFTLALPHSAYLVPVLAILLGLSFVVPPRSVPVAARSTASPIEERQASELRRLQEDLRLQQGNGNELDNLVERLKQVEARFNEHALDGRAVMIELGRMEEALSERMSELGAEALEEQITQVLPHLAAGAATREAASRLKAGRPQEAAGEMENLARKNTRGELSETDKADMALNMAVAASKLGSRSKNSLGSDLSKASESLKANDAKSFESASRSIGDKFRDLDRYKKLQKAKERISTAKAGLGQKECPHCDGAGCPVCQQGKGRDGKQDGRKNGLEAGTETAGDPRGDQSRLEESYRELVKVTGMTGEGPVDSQTESVEGQVAGSSRDPKEVYSEYAAVAEEAIEQEDIPLSRRFHVKRYFQAIRPPE